MKQYTDLLRKILTEGRRKQNRTGTDVISLIGPQMEFNMDDGFPLVTERPIFFRGCVAEDLWFIYGVCNNQDLMAQNVKIWDKWALQEDLTSEMPRQLPDVVADYVEFRKKSLAEGETYTFEDAVRDLTIADREDMEKGLPVNNKPLDAKTNDDLMGGYRVLREAGIPMMKTEILMPKGYLGPIYGVLWRGWIDHNGQRIDQLSNIYNKLASDNPKLRYSRANIITSYNPGVLPDETVSAQENVKNGRQALAACHTMFQFFAEPLTLEERVDLHNRKVDQARADHEAQPGSDFENVSWNHVSVDALWAMSSVPAQDFSEEDGHAVLDKLGVARDQLSLKLYQRKHNCALAA